MESYRHHGMQKYIVPDIVLLNRKKTTYARRVTVAYRRSVIIVKYYVRQTMLIYSTFAKLFDVHRTLVYIANLKYLFFSSAHGWSMRVIM